MIETYIVPTNLICGTDDPTILEPEVLFFRKRVERYSFKLDKMENWKLLESLSKTLHFCCRSKA